MLTDEQVTDRLRDAFEHDTAGLEPQADLLAALERELREPDAALGASGGPRRPPRRRRWLPTPGGAFAALSVAVAVAVFAVALVALRPGHQRSHPSPPSGGATGQRATLGHRGQLYGGPSNPTIVARAPDPGGAAEWALAVYRAVRPSGAFTGKLCEEIGRIDARGHFTAATAPNAATPACVRPDARGNLFLSVLITGVPANWGAAPLRDICSPTGSAAASCTPAETRTVLYGMLGPEALSITYSRSGLPPAVRATGPGGSYLLVGSDRDCLLSYPSGGCAEPDSGLDWWTHINIEPGQITKITYRDGRVCQPRKSVLGNGTGWCAPYGYVSFAPLPFILDHTGGTVGLLVWIALLLIELAVALSRPRADAESEQVMTAQQAEPRWLVPACVVAAVVPVLGHVLVPSAVIMTPALAFVAGMAMFLAGVAIRRLGAPDRRGLACLGLGLMVVGSGFLWGNWVGAVVAALLGISAIGGAVGGTVVPPEQRVGLDPGPRFR